MREKTCQQIMPTKSVAKRLLDSVLAKHQILLNEARLENKTPREIINMN